MPNRAHGTVAEAAYAGDVSRYAVDLGGLCCRVVRPTARATRRRGRRAAMRSSCAGREAAGVVLTR